MGCRDTRHRGPVEWDRVGPGRTGPDVPPVLTRTITVTIVITAEFLTVRVIKEACLDQLEPDQHPGSTAEA